MKRVVVIVAATAMTGLIANGVYADSSKSTANTPVVHTNLAKDASSAAQKGQSSVPEDQIRSVFHDAASDALTPDNMSRLVLLFNSQAQTRITQSSSFKDDYGKKLDAQIDSFKANWNQKYGHNFSAKDFTSALGSGFASIQEGSPGHDTDLVSKVEKCTGESASSKTAKTNSELTAIQDDKIAIATVSGMKGKSDLEIPMIADPGGGWKIMVPHALTANTLRANLLSEVTALNDHASKWPSDESAAYQHVVHGVLNAVMNQTPPAKSQASAAPMTSSAKASQAVSNTNSSFHSSANPTASNKLVSNSQGSGSHWWKFWNW